MPGINQQIRSFSALYLAHVSTKQKRVKKIGLVWLCCINQPHNLLIFMNAFFDTRVAAKLTLQKPQFEAQDINSSYCF
jgi:hypothetical protein